MGSLIGRLVTGSRDGTARAWDLATRLASLVLLRQALEIFQRIGSAEAPDLLAELDALTGPPLAQ
jgi:hypothetical protein